MEQERDAQGCYIDPITLESIAQDKQLLVNGLYLSVETLYTTYAKTGKLEDPFTRAALDKDVEARVLAYGETRQIVIHYQGKEYKCAHCAQLGEAVKTILYEDEAFQGEELLWGKQPVLEQDLCTELHTLNEKQLLLLKEGQMSKQNKHRLLAYLRKDGSGMAAVLTQRLMGLAQRLMGEQPALRTVQELALMFGIDPQFIDVQIQAPPPRQQMQVDWSTIVSLLQGAPEEEILTPLEEGIDRRLTDPVEFYVSLLGEAGFDPTRLLERLCTQGGPTLRHNLLCVLWFGRGDLRCTRASFPYLAALQIENFTAHRHRLELIRCYFAQYGVPEVDETHIVPAVRALMH